MITLIMDSGYFKYQGEFYQQIEGMPMGNCLSPVVADITMDHIIRVALDTVPSPPPKLVLKYVDDLFLVVHKDVVNQLLLHFNSINEKIKFTHELEKEGELPYLDTMVKRNEDGTLSTRWYQKPIASGRILNFASLHPMKQKINTAEGLIHRVKSLTTDPLTNTDATITHLLKKNNYPQDLIVKLLEKQGGVRRRNGVDDSFNTIAETKFCSMTYIKGLSEGIAKTIKRHSKDVTLCFKADNTLGRSFTNMKDRTPLLEKSNVIYRIPCGGCRKYYLGRTSRKLGTRISEHERSTRDFSKMASSLVSHMREEHHNFAFNEVSVVDSTNRSHQLNYMEAFHINAHNRAGMCVNHRHEGNDLNHIFSALIPLAAT
ncbi:uncharacterized protein LOC129788370 [Lutzomyia longipalpis]|uniref:uncharacterized protein LOC129788370 n=1 Tax=Lutzomyia longipalpis TaxID=7200 RepID=UPI0024834FA0|nr:uncharacterized protein LOC129788370 [Lutzomyia longipalpis]